MARQQVVTVWRKLRIDLLTDEDFDYITAQLPPELATAPYMFYLAALKKADMDGAFDLEDGVIFARLMRVGTPRDVFKIANFMMERRLISRIGETNICMFVDWDYTGDNAPPRTLAQRRQQVQYKIDQAEKLAQEKLFAAKENAEKMSFDEPSFFCPENDKNAKNVTINNFGDKNQKNVVSPRENRESRLEILEIRDTHTQERLDKIDTREKKEPAEKDFSEQSFSFGGKKDAQEKKEPEEKRDFSFGAPEAGERADTAEREKGKERSESSSPREVLIVFFAKNCKGFDATGYTPQLDILSKRFVDLADERNPPDIVANVFCQQYLKLVQSGYYKDMPLLPDYMLKPAVYNHIAAAANKILFTEKPTDRWLQEQEQHRVEVEAERAGMEHDPLWYEYVKYNIDPASPQAFAQLHNAKKAEEDEPP